MKNLWSPWRSEYVGTKLEGCPLCANQERSDEDAYVIARGEHVYAMLNLYPYNAGHIMVMPKRHVGALEELTLEESAEAQRFLERSIRALRVAFAPGPHGFNVGLNLGGAAGAGIPEHLHWQLLPRWDGDTNFMPTLAEVRVMPQHMRTTWTDVRDAWAQLSDENEE
jgi:ATP adenylyltransferase